MERWDLSQAAADVIRFRDDRDWAQFHAPKNLASGLSVEAAELLEVFLWDEVKPTAEVLANEALMTRVTLELADVLIYALTLASDLDIDLNRAIHDKLADNARRYPQKDYRGRSDKAPH